MNKNNNQAQLSVHRKNSMKAYISYFMNEGDLSYREALKKTQIALKSGFDDDLMKRAKVKWEEFSYKQQIAYLRKHPNSKRKITATPNDESDIEDLDVNDLRHRWQIAQYLTGLKRTKVAFKRLGKETKLIDEKIAEFSEKLRAKTNKYSGSLKYHSKRRMSKLYEGMKNMYDALKDEADEFLPELKSERRALEDHRRGLADMKKQKDKEGIEHFTKKIEQNEKFIAQIKKDMSNFKRAKVFMDRFRELDIDNLSRDQVIAMEIAHMEDSMGGFINQIREHIVLAGKRKNSSIPKFMAELDQLMSNEGVDKDFSDVLGEKLSLQELKELTNERMDGSNYQFYDKTIKPDYSEKYIRTLQKLYTGGKERVTFGKKDREILEDAVRQELEFAKKKLRMSDWSDGDPDIQEFLEHAVKNTQIFFKADYNKNQKGATLGYYSHPLSWGGKHTIVMNSSPTMIQKFKLKPSDPLEIIRHEVAHYFQYLKRTTESGAFKRYLLKEKSIEPVKASNDYVQNIRNIDNEIATLFGNAPAFSTPEGKKEFQEKMKVLYAQKLDYQEKLKNAGSFDKVIKDKISNDDDFYQETLKRVRSLGIRDFQPHRLKQMGWNEEDTRRMLGDYLRKLSKETLHDERSKLRKFKDAEYNESDHDYRWKGGHGTMWQDTYHVLFGIRPDNRFADRSKGQHIIEQENVVLLSDKVKKDTSMDVI